MTVSIPQYYKKAICQIVFLALYAATHHVIADTQVPGISIIIDDIGYQHINDQKALALPGALTYSILPHSPHAQSFAKAAQHQGKEVLLHLPMEAESRNSVLGPGALKQAMSRKELIETLHAGLMSVPTAIGINNHMGSLLTRQHQPMSWLMQEINLHHDLFFIDSRTTAATLAANLAKQHHVPHLSRDIFLDNVVSPEAIQVQFKKLIKIAQKYGAAVAIGHPHKETLSVLKNELPALESRYGVKLIPLSLMLKQQPKRILWQASLSPSQKAAKNLKP